MPKARHAYLNIDLINMLTILSIFFTWRQAKV